MAIHPYNRHSPYYLDHPAIVFLVKDSEADDESWLLLAMVEDPDQLGRVSDQQRLHQCVGSMLAAFRRSYEGELVKAYSTNLIRPRWGSADLELAVWLEGRWGYHMVEVTDRYLAKPAEGQGPESVPLKGMSLASRSAERASPGTTLALVEEEARREARREFFLQTEMGDALAQMKRIGVEMEEGMSRAEIIREAEHWLRVKWDNHAGGFMCRYDGCGKDLVLGCLSGTHGNLCPGCGRPLLGRRFGLLAVGERFTWADGIRRVKTSHNGRMHMGRMAKVVAVAVTGREVVLGDAQPLSSEVLVYPEVINAV